MKVFLIVVLVCIGFAYGQSMAYPFKPSQVKKDTGFLYRVQRDTPYPFYHAIYIEKNRQSNYYKLLQDFRFSKDEQQNYREAMKQNSSHITRKHKSGLPEKWVPLYLYKGRYYVYAPSEWGGLCRRMLNDSTLIFWFMDGPMPYFLRSVIKTGENRYTVLSRDYIIGQEGFLRPEVLNIYIIDPKNKIAVWEYKSRKEKNWQYELVVPRENIPRFDMIVNYCNTDKQMEFDFDRIDFKALLARFRKK